MDETNGQYNQHSNDIGDWCSWSGTRVGLPEDEWDEVRCPAGCSASHVEEAEAPKDSDDAHYPLGVAWLDERIVGNPYTQTVWDVIGEAHRSDAGNTILRIGKATPGTPGWQGYGVHIVLTPAERERLIADLIAQRS